MYFPCPKRLVIRSKTFRRFMSNDEVFFFVSFPAALTMSNFVRYVFVF